jgi:hypothetical protein
LEFGSIGADHRPPLNANLPAINNGLRDRDIVRWAEAIRGFAKPVYLTVLLQADRNWSVSSGVANGGIPQDVPKAWKHIQSIFRAAGANNVSWVWAPADPIHDQRFAPPLSTIDVVLQSFINYPGTTWGNPSEVLRSLTHRYPSKPIFVEASAAGSPAEKASWLASLQQAVDSNSHVYAVLYHEGGPGLVPTSAQEKLWSIASDPESLAAMKQLIASLRSPHPTSNRALP